MRCGVGCFLFFFLGGGKVMPASQAWQKAWKEQAEWQAHTLGWRL